MDLTISIVSHGHGSLVETLLSSLEEHRPSLRLEVLLTQNVPEPNPRGNVARSFPVRVFENRSARGFAENHNDAFRSARGRFFCVVNPDIVFVENVFPRLLAHLETSNVAFVAPGVFDSRGIIQDNCRRLPTPSVLLRRRILGAADDDLAPVEADGCIRPDWIAGMFLLARSEVFQALGGFDPKFHLYFEDVDLGARCILQGYSLLVDTTVRVVHEARRSSRRDPRYLLWHLTSALRFFASDVYREVRKAKSEPEMIVESRRPSVSHERGFGTRSS